MKPYLYFMVGLPGSGKSTTVKLIQELIPTKPTILSTDDYIEKLAYAHNATYDEMFRDNIKDAETFLNSQLDLALIIEKDIIWDQTNLTVKARAKKLSKIPATYRKIACVVQAPTQEEWYRRLNRPGKTIPLHILTSMANSFTMPTLEEGFEQILYFGG